MVLFNNIRVGQEVEVYWRNRIWAGKVQYAGPVFGREGNWVGVELKKPGSIIFFINSFILDFKFY